MHEIIWLRSHLERCLQDILDSQVEPDSDGDYAIAAGTALGYIKLEEGSPTLIRVQIWAALDVPMSTKLTKELNDINANLRTGRVIWADDSIQVVDSVLAESLSRDTLRYAMSSSFTHANELGPMLSAVFAGRLPIDAASVDDESAA